MGPRSVRYIIARLDDGAPSVLALIADDLVLIADGRVHPESDVAAATSLIDAWVTAHQLDADTALEVLAPLVPRIITGRVGWPPPVSVTL